MINAMLLYQCFIKGCLILIQLHMQCLGTGLNEYVCSATVHPIEFRLNTIVCGVRPYLLANGPGIENGIVIF